MENDLLYKKLVAEMSADRELLLDDVGRLVKAEICAGVRPLVEAQAKTHHQVADLYNQQDELRVKMQDIEKEMEAQRVRASHERNEIVETRASLMKAEEMVGQVWVEAALAAASIPPPQPAPINALADWNRRPDPAKVRVVAAEAVSRDAVQAVVARHCGDERLVEEHYSLQEGRELSKSFVVTFLGEPWLAARRATMKSADGTWRQPSVRTPSGAEARIWLDPRTGSR